MAYVSNCLTHWAGKGKKKEEAYHLLTRCILAKKELIYRPNTWSFRSKYGGIRAGARFRVPMICFTDIPFSECGTHCRRYSRVGLSFDKGYLVNCLASPVGYVQNPFVWQYYSDIYHSLQGVRELVDGVAIPRGKRQGQTVSVDALLYRFQYMCNFLSNCSKREFPYEENSNRLPSKAVDFFEQTGDYYYEREWRMVPSQRMPSFAWNVEHDGAWYFQFNEEHLKYVILPRQYLERLRTEQDVLFKAYSRVPTLLPFEDLAFF